MTHSSHPTLPFILLNGKDEDLFRQELLALIVRLSYRYREEPFKLKAGGTSNHYIDGRQVSLHGRGSFLIGALFLSWIEKHYPEARAIGGLTLGADPLVSATTMVADLVGIAGLTRISKIETGFLVRKEVKGHGVADLVVGANHIPAGSKVVVCDDVITTGGSMLEGIAGARSRGWDVIGCLALVDRGEHGGIATVRAEIPNTFALFTLDEVFHASL